MTKYSVPDAGKKRRADCRAKGNVSRAHTPKSTNIQLEVGSTVDRYVCCGLGYAPSNNLWDPLRRRRFLVGTASLLLRHDRLPAGNALTRLFRFFITFEVHSVPLATSSNHFKFVRTAEKEVPKMTKLPQVALIPPMHPQEPSIVGRSKKLLNLLNRSSCSRAVLCIAFAVRGPVREAIRGDAVG